MNAMENEDGTKSDSTIRSEGWKEKLRADFEAWLATADSFPEPADRAISKEVPDLYSFYAQLSAFQAESRKSNRRTAEAFGQWSDALGRFGGDLQGVRAQVEKTAAEAAAKGLSRAHCLILVELLDRLRRVEAAFASPPSLPWWQGTRGWQTAWERQRQAMNILVGHLDAILRKEGVSRMDALGQPFDPTTMAAVAVENDTTRPEQTVLEEFASGYRLHGELLRPAQVKVSNRNNSTTNL